MTSPAHRLPHRLVSWYGDDFTGSAAVAEVLEFGGIPSVLFLDIPDEQTLEQFSECRAIGIAGTARSRSPAWMETNLPPIVSALADLGAPLVHYKVCSTLDSAPHIGSIGKAIDIGGDMIGGGWIPVFIPSPELGRYQAFGTLFARLSGEIHRLDRHPVMRRHPVTPMDEADVTQHLSRQTASAIDILDLLSLREDHGQARLDDLCRRGRKIVVMDAVDEQDLARAGALIWTNRGRQLFGVGSQGFESALLAHWRAAGVLSREDSRRKGDRAERVVAVSGSVSESTARQIEFAGRDGFALIPLDPMRLVTPDSAEQEVAQAMHIALTRLSEGRSVLLHTACGPQDSRSVRTTAFLDANPSKSESLRAEIGERLGRCLRELLVQSGVKRAIASGGDSSGHALRQLDLYALRALWPTVPGAAMCRGYSRDRQLDGLEIALKGGQMGSPDFFRWIRDGASAN